MIRPTFCRLAALLFFWTIQPTATRAVEASPPRCGAAAGSSAVEQINACSALIAFYREEFAHNRNPTPPKKVYPEAPCYRENTPECWGRARLAKALYARSILLVDEQDLEGAFRDINEAVSLAPNWRPLYFHRVNVNIRRKDFTPAMQDADYLYKVEPSNMDFLLLRCDAHVAAGDDLALAKRLCDRALEQRPQSPEVMELVGFVHFKSGDYTGAYDLFNAASRWDPSAPGYTYARGVAAAHLGRTDESVADIARAEKLDPKIAAIYEVYGITR